MPSTQPWRRRAALTVLEPTGNGIGGDAFAIVWDGQKLHGLDASGRAPAALTVDVLRKQGLNEVPADGWLPVTVPGAVSAWVELTAPIRSRPVRDLLEPAARYAEEGHPVPPVIAAVWSRAQHRFGHRQDFADTFLPGGRAQEPGEIFAAPIKRARLRLIGESDGEAFYRGELAEKIADYAKQTGGLLTKEDLAVHRGRVGGAHSAPPTCGYDVWKFLRTGKASWPSWRSTFWKKPRWLACLHMSAARAASRY